MKHTSTQAREEKRQRALCRHRAVVPDQTHLSGSGDTKRNQAGYRGATGGEVLGLVELFVELGVVPAKVLHELLQVDLPLIEGDAFIWFRGHDFVHTVPFGFSVLVVL